MSQEQLDQANKAKRKALARLQSIIVEEGLSVSKVSESIFKDSLKLTRLKRSYHTSDVNNQLIEEWLSKWDNADIDLEPLLAVSAKPARQVNTEGPLGPFRTKLELIRLAKSLTRRQLATELGVKPTSLDNFYKRDVVTTNLFLPILSYIEKNKP